MKTVQFSPLHRRLVAGFVTLASAGIVLGATTDLPYSSGSTGADGPLTFREIIPGGRSYSAVAYYPPTQKVILFGGYLNGSVAGTWEWDGNNWRVLNTAAAPTPRYSHTMVYDAARQRLVLFGGYSSQLNQRLNDTWVFDGVNWEEKSPATEPPARDDANMAYDAAREKVLLFGGQGLNGEQGQNTWLWDGTNWTLTATVSRPPNYVDVAIAYHAARQEVVMFNNANETWIWNGSDWSQRVPVNRPGGRSRPQMAEDGTGNLIMFGGDGRSDTWSWDGVDWTQKNTSPMVNRATAGMTWDATRQRIVMFGGYISGDQHDADTWLWDGTDWSFWSGKRQTFDMSGRANGIWNFTSINIPEGITVSFRKNAGNTPVRWLATENIQVEGVIDVSGEFGDNGLAAGTVAEGGPGGFAGGRGAVRRDQSGSNVGSPGQGPGGGLPGTDPATNPVNLRDGRHGNYANSGADEFFGSAYGNVFIQPLVGGSGGGGGASSETSDGGNGGGGGGAILLASSKDVIINGAVLANGGDIQWSNASYGGRGSGGAVLIRGDRISGNGRVDAYGGTAGGAFQNGRIRLEAYYRQLAGSTRPISVNSAPIANQDNNTLASLSVTQVAGQNVAQPPTGNTLTPDVVFTSAGPITVTVQGANIPDATPVRLRITTSESVIEAGPVNLSGNTAVFSGVVVPAGIGTVQAFAQFNLSN